MNQEARRDPINDGRKNEKKRGNHSTESIRPVRYAKGIYFGRGSVKRAATFANVSAAHGRATTADYFAAPASALLSRALRRFAAFLWMIPRLAALSIAEISRRI